MFIQEALVVRKHLNFHRHRGSLLCWLMLSGRGGLRPTRILGSEHNVFSHENALYFQKSRHFSRKWVFLQKSLHFLRGALMQDPFKIEDHGHVLSAPFNPPLLKR